MNKPISQQRCVTTQRTRNLFWKRSRTEKEKEEKVRNRDIQWHFQPKKKSTLLSGLKLLTCHPVAKSQAAILKISWKATSASTKTGYRSPNVHTFWLNQVHIVVGGAMGDVSSASNDSIFPLHHFFVDRIYEKWLRKFNKDASVLSTYNAPIRHNKDNVIVTLYPVYTKRG